MDYQTTTNLEDARRVFFFLGLERKAPLITTVLVIIKQITEWYLGLLHKLRERRVGILANNVSPVLLHSLCVVIGDP